jgi:hypothetical protein
MTMVGTSSLSQLYDATYWQSDISARSIGFKLRSELRNSLTRLPSGCFSRSGFVDSLVFANNGALPPRPRPLRGAKPPLLLPDNEAMEDVVALFG